MLLGLCGMHYGAVLLYGPSTHVGPRVQGHAPLWAPCIQKTIHVSRHAVLRLLSFVAQCSSLQCSTEYAGETRLLGISLPLILSRESLSLLLAGSS